MSPWERLAKFGLSYQIAWLERRSCWALTVYDGRHHFEATQKAEGPTDREALNALVDQVIAKRDALHANIRNYQDAPDDEPEKQPGKQETMW